ncbi:MAG: thiamine-phosphate kinase [Bacteroidales bacterium]|nr:thiamine-phosphate kinase [Bacteroidales bacterium]
MTTTKLSEYGEFGLIEHLTKDVLIKNKSTLKGIGDDCAILETSDLQTVITTDLLLEGIHFDLSYCPLKHLGYKAVIANLSDVYAMNATPEQITVSIGVSAKFTVEALELLYSGIKLACNKHNVDLVGGDTSASLTGLIISITAIGKVSADKVVKRDGAKINDLICVSGNLGAAYLGLQILEREKSIYTATGGAQPELSKYDYVLERQLKPEARKDIISELASLNIVPTAMIDISDGLSSELIHICSQSQVGCKIYEERIPIASETEEAAKEFDIEPLISVLNGGEDYELLFTIKISDYEKIQTLESISVIGNICSQEEGLSLVSKSGNFIELKAQGWKAL